jgi:hypothetical protein
MYHCVFASSLANRVCGGSSSAARSFVLAALRALHLDPRLRSTAPDTGPEREGCFMIGRLVSRAN